MELIFGCFVWGPCVDGMYTISEMASIFGVSRQTLIYYDKIGLFAPAEVNEKGYRFYSPTQIPLMRLICMLRDLGVDLDEIMRLTSSYDVAEMANKLRERVSELDGQIAALEKERNSVQERLSFYSDVSYWKARQGVPTLKAFPNRYVIVEPFPGDVTIDRSVLHPTLMRAVARLRETMGAQPMRGWGTMLQRSYFHSDNPILGAGPFAVVPDGVEPEKLGQAQCLPEGVYLCISRWGMPYNPAGIREAVSYLDAHNLTPMGNAYDFCYMDATSYNEEHQEDFCCIQIPVAL